jgi:hypothetical protein
LAVVTYAKYKEGKEEEVNEASSLTKGASDFEEEYAEENDESEHKFPGV